MLQNPKWDKPKELSLSGLISWLSTQDPATRYVYDDTKNCLFCQYYRAMGYEVPGAGGSFTRVVIDGTEKSINTEYQGPVSYGGGDWTYGGALERAKKYAANNPD